MSRIELVSTVEIPAIENFSVDAHFRVGETDGVLIGWLGENFRRVFGGRVGSVAKATLRVHRLVQASTDAEVIAELGVLAEVSLGQLWRLIKAQGHGQEGDLLVDGRANVAYVCAADGLWAVRCFWSSHFGDWFVEAFPFTALHGWRDGSQVVSR